MKKADAHAFFIRLVLGVAVASGATRGQGNIVVNGGFESRNPSTGWEGTYGSIESVDAAGFAKEGKVVGGLFINEPLSQRLNTEPSMAYVLEFSLRSGHDGESRPVTVQWGSQTVGDFLNPDSSQWQTFRRDITAGSSVTELGFVTSGPDWMIDEVSVTAVPEPTSVALVIVAAGTMVVCRRKGG